MAAGMNGPYPPMEPKPKRYKFDKERGIVDEADNQVLQLVGGTAKFRKLCGDLLVERLNVKSHGDFFANRKPNR